MIPAHIGTIAARHRASGGGGGSTHRYWSLKILATTGPESYIDTISMATITGGANVALLSLGGRTAIGTPGQYAPANPPSEAFDGSTGTAFDPGNQSIGAFVGLVFDDALQIVEYKLRCSFNDFMCTGWEFRHSDDGVTWTVVDTRSAVSWSNGETKTFAIA